MMDEKSGAETMVLVAADRWAREIMRSDKELDFVEQKLFDAVMHYRIIMNAMAKTPSSLPKPPFVPKDMIGPADTERPTMRYSEPTTIPTPAGGFLVDDIEIERDKE